MNSFQSIYLQCVSVINPTELEYVFQLVMYLHTLQSKYMCDKEMHIKVYLYMYLLFARINKLLYIT